MSIEIVEIGGAGRWVLDGPRVRIGRAQQCEICLPDARYSALTGDPVTLELVDGVIRMASLGTVQGGIFLNDNPASIGFVVRSGDTLRLGTSGPELRIRLMEQQSSAPIAEYTPTRIFSESTQVAYEPTRVDYEPTRVLSGAEATTVSAPPPRPSGAPGRYGYETQVMSGESTSRAAASPNPNQTFAPSRKEAAAGTAIRQDQEAVKRNHVQEVRMQGAQDSAGLRALEGKLKSMRMILWANLAAMAVLLLLVFQLGQQLDQNRQELRELRAQAQTAVGQLTPALDARLNVFERRMDGIDAKMKQAEDRLVNRMNAEIPSMLDQYINHKLAEVKR